MSSPRSAHEFASSGLKSWPVHELDQRTGRKQASTGVDLHPQGIVCRSRQ